MKPMPRILIAALLSAATSTAFSQADDYLSETSEKFTRGITNVFTGLVEIPKNIAWVSHETHPALGVPGGLLLGTLQTIGRTGIGVLDVILTPIPTRNLIDPPYVFYNFDKLTTYGGTTARTTPGTPAGNQPAPSQP